MPDDNYYFAAVIGIILGAAAGLIAVGLALGLTIRVWSWALG